MVIYNCNCCNFETKIKSHLKRHTQTRKHKNIAQDSTNIALYSTNIAQESKLCCKYCSTTFKHQPSLSRHIKYYCKKNEDEDLQELVKLMNEQLQEQNKKVQTIEKKTIEMSREIEKRDKKIMKLTNKLQINNGVINNINILNYKDTDLSHLTDKDYAYCIGRTNNSIKALTELIHFNPDKPENMNVFKSNLKNEYITLKERDIWVVKKYIDDFIEDKELILEDWLDREGEKFPGLRDKFEMFMQNKENANILNTIKENICLLMYNNRDKIKQIGN